MGSHQIIADNVKTAVLKMVSVHCLIYFNFEENNLNAYFICLVDGGVVFLKDLK